ncbi:FecR domain-containing protein [Blastopirellula sp. JC732]|uniref:FecR domain-containing protein n=1 Tax=Blastopirellula sediminis TaxID=2894196 RepID=A0A9X1MQT3_9BACT|nr:FecR domain-containing protein [Blastopirellula sediminis]MCC9606819.1 FecR domain-containing protein [Blastopirellula sediminis]MCC9629884.1 FecR domain-containing protein [Blastopirellula sediminis]
MSTTDPRVQLLQLLTELDAGDLSDDQTAQLEQLLLQHPDLRKTYLRRIATRAQLSLIARRRAKQVKLPEQQECPLPPPDRSERSRLTPWAIAASLLLAATLIGVYWNSQRNQADTTPVAAVTRLADNWWGASEMSADLGKRLIAGESLWLESGLVEITLESGAVITMDGACLVQIADANSIVLSRGVIHALVPPSARGFTVKTEQVDIVDIGAKFTAAVDELQAVEVHVHEGKVELRPNRDAADPQPGEVIAAGMSVRFDPDTGETKPTEEFKPYQQISPPDGKHIAYTTRAGTRGNHVYAGKVGQDFIVNETIEVTRLGVFDSKSDGLRHPLYCEIWSRDDRGTPNDTRGDFGIAMAARLEFTPDDPGELVESNRFKPLEAPLTLPPGSYSIVAFGFSEEDPMGNDHHEVGVQRNRKTRDDAGGAISFVGTSRYDINTEGPHAFPGHVDKHWADRYSAGTFEYRLLEPFSAKGQGE